MDLSNVPNYGCYFLSSKDYVTSTLLSNHENKLLEFFSLQSNAKKLILAKTSEIITLFEKGYGFYFFENIGKELNTHEADFLTNKEAHLNESDIELLLLKLLFSFELLVREYNVDFRNPSDNHWLYYAPNKFAISCIRKFFKKNCNNCFEP